MNRRSFLTLTEESTISQILTKTRTISDLSPYQGPWEADQAVHLLKRAMFGTRKADIDYYKKLTLEQAVDELINNPVPAFSPPVNNYNVNGYTDPTGIAAGSAWVNAPYGDNTVNSRRTASYKAWWMGQMINQSRSLQEKMVLFWHNHFATATSTIGDARLEYLNNAMLRKNALGNFQAFVKENTLDPGMLKYLNGYLNTKAAPDENYGRELQELFTVGKGPDSHYTEDDVKAAARVLTGFRIDLTKLSSYFDATRHDPTNKQFSAFYNNTVVTGRTGPDGAKELDDMISMILAQPEPAKFICRKLYRFFVYYNIDDATEANVISPLADVFRKTNYDIKQVLYALFTSQHFFDPLNMGCLIKSPVEFMVGLCREYNIILPDPADYVNAYTMWDYLHSQTALIQEDIGDPPTVSGWPAYYEAPQYHELWINSDTLPRRNQFTDTLIGNGVTRNGKKIVIDPIAFARSLSDPATPSTLVSDSLAVLYRISVSQEVKDYLKTNFLLEGQSNDYYWTGAWNAYVSNPGDAANKNIVLTHLQNLYKYMMDSSEFQLS